MLWAAWADALGFISELTDSKGLERRLQGKRFDRPVAWQRRVGGQYGVMADLPAGTYSDDTQLRLATARAISANGFDVEAFARVELPLWPSYALGGGRASKAAAANMAKSKSVWFANFFDAWHLAGGNGAAMRIQPHVWAAPALETHDYLADVLANSVISHGHPRALVGASLHAVSLALALREGRSPSVGEWHPLLDIVDEAFDVFNQHPELSGVWRPAWERANETDWSEAWRQTVGECRGLVTAMSTNWGTFAEDPTNAYRGLIDLLGLAARETRGSGTGTVLASLALAAAFPDNPAEAALVAAHAIGTDTDTIATMTAAVAGAGCSSPDPEPLVDSDYLRHEARRLTAIALNQPAKLYPYPDLLHWVPPKTQLDCVGLVDDRPALAGLSFLTPSDGTFKSRDSVWTWMRTDFGMSLLLKHRPALRDLPLGNVPASGQSSTPAANEPAGSPTTVRDTGSLKPDAGSVSMTHEQEQLPLTESAPTSARPHAADSSSGPPVDSPNGLDVDVILRWLRNRGFNERDIGYAIRRVAQDGSVEQLIALATAVRQSLSR